MKCGSGMAGDGIQVAKRKEDPTLKIEWPMTVMAEVIWRDANSRNGWTNIEDAYNTLAPSWCKTIGYVLRDDAKEIVLAGSQSPADLYSRAQVTELMAVPKDWVGKITYLKK